MSVASHLPFVFGPHRPVRKGFAAEHSADAPRIDEHCESSRFRGGDQLPELPFVIPMVLFGISENDEVASLAHDLIHVALEVIEDDVIKIGSAAMDHRVKVFGLPGRAMHV